MAVGPHQAVLPPLGDQQGGVGEEVLALGGDAELVDLDVHSILNGGQGSPWWMFSCQYVLPRVDEWLQKE